jgi:hypothetical protein
MLAKNSNRNIWALCERKSLDVAWVCTRRANACGVTAVTVRSAFACKFTVTTAALSTQYLSDSKAGCAYQHELLAPCYLPRILRLETELI